jgi:hypothetical protein
VTSVSRRDAIAGFQPRLRPVAAAVTAMRRPVGRPGAFGDQGGAQGTPAARDAAILLAHTTSPGRR